MTERGASSVTEASADASPSPAEIYEKYYVPALFEPWTQELLVRAAPQPGERVLDVACGTGIVARRVAPLVGADATVVGLDINPDMLTVARTAAIAEGVRIEWQDGNAEALPFADASFDLVLCQQGLHVMSNREAATREMRRVLGPGGRAVIAVWHGMEHNPLNAVLNDVIERHLRTPVLAAAFSLSNPAEVRGWLDRAGFSDVTLEVVKRTVRYPEPERFLELTVMAAIAAVPALAEMDETRRAELVQAVKQDATGALQPFIDKDEVVEPGTAHIAVARV